MGSLNYSDRFCAIQDMRNGRAWYADISMTAFDMPLRWAEKIVELFRAGNIEKACHYIDMVQKNWR